MDRDLRIRMLLEAADRATRPMRAIADGAGRLAGAVAETRQRLKQLSAVQSDIAAFRALRRGMDETENAMQQAQARVAALAREIAGADAPAKKLTAEFERAKRAAAALKTEHGEQAARVQQLRARLNDAGVGTGNLAEHERDLREAIRRTNGELSDHVRRLREANDRARRFGDARAAFGRTADSATGVAASGFSAIQTGQALSRPLVASGDAAMGLEEAMADVAKVTGMGAPAIAAMRQRLVELSTRIPMTATELTTIAAAAGAAGVGMDRFGNPLPSQARDLVAFTDAAARMGIAFGISAEDAGATMATWRQAFSMTQPEVEALGDRINALTNRFGGSAAAVNNVVTRIGPLGRVAGMGAAQIAALGSTLNSMGVADEIAATGLKNMMLSLTKGAAATKSQKQALRALGLESGAVAQGMQRDASGTILTVMQALSRLPQEQQAGMLTQLFGSESVAAIAPLLTNLDGVRQRLSLVGDRAQYAGSMTREFETRINTSRGAVDIATNGLQSLNLMIGQALLPSIRDGARWVTRISGAFSRFAGRNPAVAKTLAIITAVLAGLFVVFGMGAVAIAGIMGPIAILNAGLVAMGVAGGIASVGLLPIIGIAAAIVAGIALLAGAAYLIYRNWDRIVAFFSGIWEQVKTAFDGGLWGILTLFARWRAEIVAVLANAIRAAVGWIIANFPAAWDVAGKFIWNIFWNGLMLFPRLFFQFGVNTLKGFVRGLMNALGWVRDAIGRVGSNVIGWFKQKLGIHSPSRVFAGLGGYMMQGLAIGLDRGSGAPIARITQLSGRMAAVMAATAPSIQSTQAMSRQSASAIVDTARRPTGGADAAGMSVNINIHAAPGQSAQEIADAVRREIERMRHEQTSNARAAFGDDPDWA